MSHHSQTTKKEKRSKRLGCGHLPAPNMDEDTGPQYLFVVVSHKDNKDLYSSRLNHGYFSSILQLETPRINNPEYGPNLAPGQVKPKQVKEKEYIARFSQVQVGPSPIGWLFSPPSSSSEDLYIMPDCTLKDYYIHVGAPLHGFKLNMRNLKIDPIIPPTASKLHGHAINREGHIYFMAHPDSYYETPDPVFECYDPVENKWKSIEPFPDHDVRPSRHSIVATAVWDDTILYFMGHCEIWAYNVHKNNWYKVTVKDDQCYNIVGEAVVVKNTIYALSVGDVRLDLVLALSIEREEINGEPKFICSLLSEYSVQGMDQFMSEHAKAFRITKHLVHLGEDNFCLVRSCNSLGLNRYQPIQLTSIKLIREGLIVTGVCVYEVEIYSDKQYRAIIKEAKQLQADYEFDYGIYNEITHFQDILRSKHDLQFEVRLCFTLPECKTNAVKHGVKLRDNLDPFPPVDDESKDQSEGICIRIRNVPLSATIKQLESDAHLLGYSPSGMRVVMNITGLPFAIVEYESLTSKQHAIKVASSVMIGDGLSLADSHKASSSSCSGKYRFNNHCEVSQSKTICGGYNEKEGVVGAELRSRSKSSPSLFVVVSWAGLFPASISILQLDTQNTNHEYAALSLQKKKKKKMIRDLPMKARLLFSDIDKYLSQKEYVAHLSRPPGSGEMRWAFTSSKPAKVYMLPYRDLSDRKIYFPMHGCIFDLSTKTIKRSECPKANKFAGHAVSLGGCIYFMANPSLGSLNLDPAFERYDPFSDKWNALEPFPLLASRLPSIFAVVTATIVLEKAILYNMLGRAIWAYDVVKGKWYPVAVADSRCYHISGEAVMLENKFYAVAGVPDLILALSIERLESGDDLVFKCSVCSSIPVAGMEGITKDVTAGLADASLITRHLVHLGEDKNFCLVQSYKFKDGLYDYQPIQVIKIKLQEDSSMAVIDNRIHELRVPKDHYFDVRHCFSLPVFENTALHTGERIFYLDPYPDNSVKGDFSICKQIQSHRVPIPWTARKASFLGDGALSERSNPNEEGHSIILRDLPWDATFRHVQDCLKQFVLIKEEGIQITKDNTGRWSAIVEFESKTIKQSAMQMISLLIRDRPVSIEDYPAPVSAD